MTISQDFNPFANQAIHIPKAYHEDLNLHSTTFGSSEGGSKDIEEAPFKRYVDFWLLAAAVGASHDHFMTVDPSERHEFITGVVLQRDLAAIEFLFLLAIAHTADPFVVQHPRQVLDIAEGYAAARDPSDQRHDGSGPSPGAPEPHTQPGQVALTRCGLVRHRLGVSELGRCAKRDRRKIVPQAIPGQSREDSRSLSHEVNGQMLIRR